MDKLESWQREQNHDGNIWLLQAFRILSSLNDFLQASSFTLYILLHKMIVNKLYYPIMLFPSTSG